MAKKKKEPWMKKGDRLMRPEASAKVTDHIRKRMVCVLKGYLRDIESTAANLEQGKRKIEWPHHFSKPVHGVGAGERGSKEIKKLAKDVCVKGMALGVKPITTEFGWILIMLRLSGAC